MDNVFEDWLETYFDEESPKDFYRSIFPSGELEEKGVQEKGKYTAIALCLSTTERRARRKKRIQPDGSVEWVYVYNDDGSKKTEPRVFRFTITDDLNLIDELTQRDDLFCIMSPLSYAGKERTADRARFMYAMTFDLDHIRQSDDGKPIGLINLWNGHIERAARLPKPTYIVSSGTGLHLYYVFERPIPLFRNVVDQLQKLKRELTMMLWNESIVAITDEKDIQQEGIFQGFRMPGTITKRNDGSRARAFLTGEKVTIEYLNQFVPKSCMVTKFAYKSKLSKTEAKEKYPQWYEERIEQGKKGILRPWAVNRRLYDWWKREIMRKARVGHRYYCLMILSAYAMKCGFYDEKKNPNPVTEAELHKDAFEIMKFFEALTVAEDNHFDESDVLDAIDAYDRGMLTFPRNSVEYRAGFALPKNKRNYKKQEWHLEDIRTIKANMKRRGQEFKNPEGRPEGSGTKAQIVRDWRDEHPNGKKIECQRDTGLSRPTVLKWWDWASFASD